MSVGVRQLRSRLREYLERASAGHEVVVTERGRPIARLTGIHAETTLERLVKEGLVTPPKAARTPIRVEGLPRLRDGTLSELVLDERRERD